MWQFIYFAYILVFFHVSEFSITAYYHWDTLSRAALLMQREYLIAMSAAIIEYWVEYFLFPSMKSYTMISYVGLIVVIFGELLRKWAMIQAGRNFTHMVMTSRREEHKLVKTGLYKYLRHPGYTGWFYWSIATQVMLLNPLCVCLFTYASWNFFADRIPFEEEQLIRFFGWEYVKYKKESRTFIPYIE